MVNEIKNSVTHISPITSRVQVDDACPRLVINEITVPPMSYITYFTECNRYVDFAAAGYNLFSVPVFFGGRSINPRTGASPMGKGIYDVKNAPSYGILDNLIDEILAASPNAYIFPRVNLMMPQWWCEDNPLECNDTGIGKDAARECFSSSKWKEDAGNMLRDFIAYIEASTYRDHIIGYLIANGRTEEWFPFDECGSIGPATRQNLQKQYAGEISESEWCYYINKTVASAIDYFAGIVKECTGRRLVIGCFYGYTLEVTDSYSGHHAMEQLLESKNIDFFCAPSSYMGARSPGQDWASMTALDSIRLHGKMFFTEHDTRTCLTRPLRKSRPFGCVPGTYESGVWRGPCSLEVSRWLLKNNVARQLTHGTGSWWFDMWGGWFADQEIMEDMARYRYLFQQTMGENKSEYNQVAVLIDEQAYSLLPRNSTLAGECCYKSREALGLCGVPYAIYQICDFPAIAAAYQAFIFLVPVETDRLQNAITFCKDNQIPSFIVDESALPLKTSDLRQFCQKSNIHIWCESDEVIYAGNGWFSIHAATAGRKQIQLPQGYVFIEDNVNGLSLTMQQYETRLFRIRKL